VCVGAALASSWLSLEQGPCFWTTLRDALLSLLLRTEIEQQQMMRLYSYIILKLLITLNYFNNQIFQIILIIKFFTIHQYLSSILFVTA
jgi:hypothetical protein